MYILNIIYKYLYNINMAEEKSNYDTYITFFSLLICIVGGIVIGLLVGLVVVPLISGNIILKPTSTERLYGSELQKDKIIQVEGLTLHVIENNLPNCTEKATNKTNILIQLCN